MKSIPKVTVGIPVYNGERFIRMAVMSVLHQTYEDFELIITDDGSKASTLEILSKIKDPRLIVISDGENRGIAYRLNQQISMAKGEFFVRMDADDIMMPDRLKSQYDFLHKYPKVDVIGSSAVVIDNDNRIIGKRCATKKKMTNDDLFFSTKFIHPTVAGRTEWFRKWGYNEKLSGNEDMELWIRSNEESVSEMIEEPLLFYRDPYYLRLKTYINRNSKGIQCCWLLRKYANSVFVVPKYLAKTLIADVVSIILTAIGKEKLIIKRRNTPIDGNELDMYNSMLNDVLINS